MTWSKLSDDFFRHPKIVAVGKDARDLFMAALCHCNEHLIDGFVDARYLRQLAAEAIIEDAEAGADALVAAGLWATNEAGGWLIRDWIGCGSLPDPSVQDLRSTREYKDWREAVLTRDGFTCRRCSSMGVKLHAHHLRPFATFAEGRFDVLNGVTLCIPCHEFMHGRRLQ